ncbi:MAG: hypothetical protein KGH65_02500 [Candidatus Micrarchaeota archaeon]|nr:hypothetical protein [Candidatus Micrarchaeota archaeon]
MAISKASFFVFLLSLILTSGIYHAQLGQAAGAFIINMSIGSTAERNWSLVNTGDVPLGYKIILPEFTPVPNATAPIVTAVPMNGTIPAHTSVTIKVIINLPYLNNKAGIRWDSVIGSVAQPLNFTQGTGGAQIQGGVGKEIVIRAQPPTIPPLELAAVVIAAVAVIGGAIYYYKFKFLPKYNSKESKAARAKAAKEKAKEKLSKMEAKLKVERSKLLAQARAIKGSRGTTASQRKTGVKKSKSKAKGGRTSRGRSARKK